jgi:hypothetical protein
MPAPQRYDYSEALKQLQSRIEQISDWQAQQRPAPSALRPLVQLWRTHKSSIIALGTLYSISTASVISVYVAERQLQVRHAGLHPRLPAAAGSSNSCGVCAAGSQAVWWMVQADRAPITTHTQQLTREIER